MATKTHVTTDTTQTLSNKTLDNTSTANIKDSNLVIQDNADATKQVRLEASGVTAGQTRVLTVPDFDGTIVTAAGAQVLTNKDIDGGTASNTNRVTMPKDTLANLQALTRKEGTVVYATDTDKLYYDDGSVLTAVGSGSGSGSKSYATEDNSTADVALGSGWTTADVTAYPPTTYSGGTVTATFARTTSSPLQGAGSMLFTPGGQYDSAVFTFPNGIDRADFARMHRIEFDYEIGTYTSYTDGDVKLAVVCASDSGFTTDVQVIQPAGHSILKVAGQETHVATFQSHASNLYYKIFLVQTTTATGYTLKIDNFKVGPQSVAYGAPVTDPVSYVPTFTGFGTVSNIECYSWRVGTYLHVQGRFVSGTTTATEARISLGYGGVDGNVTIGSQNGPSRQMVGTIVPEGVNSADDNFVVLSTQGNTYVTFGETSSNDGNTSINGSVFAPSQQTSFNFRVPILGWSSNVVVSDSADTRVVAAEYYGNGGTAITADTTDITFSTKVEDTHGAWSGTVFSCPVPGNYNISASAYYTTSTNSRLDVYKNGSLYGVISTTGATDSIKVGATQLFLNTGDTISIRSSASLTLNNSNVFHRLAIHRIAGPAQIAASESIEAEASGSSQTITTSDTTIVATTVEFDSHGSYSNSTGKFTAQISGKYEAILHASSAGLTFSGTNRAWYAKIRKTAVGGGTTDTTIGYTSNGTTTSHNLNLDKSVRVKLLAGESLEWRTSHDTQITDFTMDQVRVGFRKIGNY